MESSFRFSVDPTGKLGGLLAPQVSDGEVVVSSEEVRVRLGDPPMFNMTIPRSEIVKAELAPDLKRATRGVHGFRGRWLVNLSGRGLVRMTLAKRLPALFTAKPEMVPALASARWLGRAVGRVVMRDRTLRVRELTVAVEDPEALVELLN